jgi:hypothetical protein
MLSGTLWLAIHEPCVWRPWLAAGDKSVIRDVL